MDKTASIQLVAYPQKSRLQGGYPGMGPPLKQRAPQRASQQQVKGGGGSKPILVSAQGIVQGKGGGSGCMVHTRYAALCRT